MISWISGKLICSWLKNQKSFVLINCQGLGYEIQTPVLLDQDLKNELILWLHHIKREDSESFYGFENKDERDFFRDLINIKGIGPQIGMALFNKYSLNEVIYALSIDDRRLINSVPGIGQKMTERIFLELKNKVISKNNNYKLTNRAELERDDNLEIILEDIKLALSSLDYPKYEIQNTITELFKDYNHDLNNRNLKNKVTFEDLFKKSLNLLEGN